MKFLVLVVFLVGFACVSGKEEEEEVSLQDLEHDEASSRKVEDAARSTLDPMLAIGNVVNALAGAGGTGTGDDGLGALLSSLLVKPVVGTAVLKPVAEGLLASVVTGIAGFLQGLAELANGILSIVGLVLLIIFLIDGGDFGSLLGVGRSMAVWPTLPEFDFDFVNNPVVDTVSEMFFKAMEKYD
ncbi:unnamed protein product [Meganyctiphanes norvegica]|uniref:Uncharacterized protein n=1 Tax=Meganyctiphanes norvegica TaxID=48144 RepID=A0AAV2PWS8_MEGNR